MSDAQVQPQVKLMSNDGKEFTVGQFNMTSDSAADLLANYYQTFRSLPALS